MTNRTLAVIGIGTYILSVYSSMTTSDGNAAVSEYVIIMSGIISALFALVATIRLWKVKKLASILLASTSILLFVFEILKVVFKPSYGSALTITVNIIMIVAFASFFYAIIILWRKQNI